jgi:hypothetical protein
MTLGDQLTEHAPRLFARWLPASFRDLEPLCDFTRAPSHIGCGRAAARTVGLAGSFEIRNVYLPRKELYDQY